jgi:hypothetical protein
MCILVQYAAIVSNAVVGSKQAVWKFASLPHLHQNQLLESHKKRP